MDSKIRLEAPGMYWADVEDWGSHFIIADGYNCGKITAQIQFPTLHTVKVYLSGQWEVRASQITDRVVENPSDAYLSDDAMLAKVCRQYARGLLMEGEMIAQIFRIIQGSK